MCRESTIVAITRMKSRTGWPSYHVATSSTSAIVRRTTVGADRKRAGREDRARYRLRPVCASMGVSRSAEMRIYT